MINLNAQGNCASNSKGTGLSACIKEYGDLVGIDVYPKGYSINLTSGSLPTQQEYEKMVQNQEVFPLNNLYDFDQTTPENETASSSTGKVKQIRPSKPQYSLTWSDGGCFHKGVYDKRGYNKWDIALKFESGILYTYNASETEMKAFNAGVFDVDTYKFQQGTDPDMTKVMFQLVKPNELNLRQNFITWDALGYDMTEVNGVVDVNVNYAVTPASGTEIKLLISSVCNSDALIDSLDDVSFWSLGGTQSSPTAISAVSVEASTGALTLTLDSALSSADTVQPRLIGSNGESAAVDAAGNFYKGSAKVATIS